VTSRDSVVFGRRLSALALAAPSASASPRDFAQATSAPAVSSPTPQTPPGGTAAAPSPPSPIEVAEARITDLRTKLQITAAEEAQFTVVAEVMRANAHSMQALLAERARDTGSTAVDALRWYERLTDTHAAALEKFVPAFAALYAAMSDSQQKIADTMFQQFAERPVPPNSK
jgi:autotransporter translocation and assembly factor TamB